MDRVYGAINVVNNGLLSFVAAVLPFATGFVGIPALGFAAAALCLSSLFLYRIRVADLRMRFVNNTARRAKPPDQQKKTRGPYTLAYMLGHCFMLAYVVTIFGRL